MLGQMHIIPTGPETPYKIIKLSRPVSMAEIKEALGGAADNVGNFDTCCTDGRIQLCLAYQNPGNQVPNQWATSMRKQAVYRRFGYGLQHNQVELVEFDDELVGPVALLMGDSEFLQATLNS